MSEYVLMSDIHGNAPALQKVIDAEGIDAEYVVLGDIHGLLAYPQEVMELLNKIEPRVMLAGNHDKAIFHHNEGHVNSVKLSKFELSHTMSKLTTAQQQEMSNLPFIQVWQDGSNRIAATHAYPWPEQASGYESGNTGVMKKDVTHVASAVADDYDYVFTGHTHEQYDLDCKRFGHPVTFVNPGSLGYDSTYSIVDTDSGEIEHKSVEVDDASIKEHIKSVLPDRAPSVEQWY